MRHSWYSNGVTRGMYRSPANLLPRQFPSSDVRDDNLALAVKAHNLHADGASTAALNFVFVAEEIDPGLATTVIEPALNEHAQHGGFPSIDLFRQYSACLVRDERLTIAHDGNARLNNIIHTFRAPPDNQLPAGARLLCIGGPDLDIPTHVSRH